MKIQDRLAAIKKILEDNKAENVEIFNLENTNYMVSAVVVATATVDRHLNALSDYLRQDLKGKEEFLHTQASSEWIAIDLGDIIVHIMNEKAREKYHLESFLSEFLEHKASV